MSRTRSKSSSCTGSGTSIGTRLGNWPSEARCERQYLPVQMWLAAVRTFDSRLLLQVTLCMESLLERKPSHTITMAANGPSSWFFCAMRRLGGRLDGVVMLCRTTKFGSPLNARCATQDAKIACGIVALMHHFSLDLHVSYKASISARYSIHCSSCFPTLHIN